MLEQNSKALKLSMITGFITLFLLLITDTLEYTVIEEDYIGLPSLIGHALVTLLLGSLAIARSSYIKRRWFAWMVMITSILGIFIVLSNIVFD